MDSAIEYVEVLGKKYKLQHPGNRAVLKLQSNAINAQNGTINLEPMMDFCFEHVVVPDGHGFHPTIDNLPPKEFEAWLGILPGFLRGESMEGWKVSETRIEKGEEES